MRRTDSGATEMGSARSGFKPRRGAMTGAARAVPLCDDAALGYRRSRSAFVPGAGLALDQAYRLAHLPLIAPGHPGVIRGRDAAPDAIAYAMGRHDTVHSLVLPLPEEALAASAPFRALEADLRAAPFAAKIAWPLLERRRGKLHATLCSALAVGAPAVLDDAALRALASLGPLQVELRGLFSGNVNVGRLYLRVYPECRAGTNVVHAIQRTLGRRTTDLYLVGLYNLVDDLDPREAAALAAILDAWWDRALLRFECRELWLLAARDDLVLDGEVAARVGLTMGGG